MKSLKSLFFCMSLIGIVGSAHATPDNTPIPACLFTGGLANAPLRAIATTSLDAYTWQGTLILQNPSSREDINVNAFITCVIATDSSDGNEKCYCKMWAPQVSNWVNMGNMACAYTIQGFQYGGLISFLSHDDITFNENF